MHHATAETHYWIRALRSLGLLLFFLSVFSIEAQAQTRSVDLKRLTGNDAITIDGQVDDLWDDATISPIDRTVDGVSGPTDASDLQAQWRAAWDDTNLYILIEVTDDQVNDDNEANDGFGVDDDSPELYIDLDHGGNASPGSSRPNCYYDDNDYQLIFEDDITYLGYCNFGGDSSGDDMPAVTFAESGTASGYRVEASIPWTALGASAPTAGDVIGIDVHINDDDDGGGRDHKLTWNDEGTEEAFGQPDSFGDATLTATPLPVEIASFTAALNEGTVVLEWATTSETNNAGFDVQRRVADKGWTTVASVEGAGTTTAKQTYRIADTDLPFDASRIAYRLRQVDVDGTATFSDAVFVDRTAAQRLQLRSVYPNPAQSEFTVEFEVPETVANVQLTLHDMLGRTVRTFAVGATGRTARQVKLDGLASGIYLLRLVAGDQVQTQKVVVAR